MHNGGCSGTRVVGISEAKEKDKTAIESWFGGSIEEALYRINE